MNDYQRIYAAERLSSVKLLEPNSATPLGPPLHYSVGNGEILRRCNFMVVALRFPNPRIWLDDGVTARVSDVLGTLNITSADVTFCDNLIEFFFLIELGYTPKEAALLL